MQNYVNRKIEVFYFKPITDQNLFIGLEVCYKDVYGSYCNVGKIIDIKEIDGFKYYQLNTSQGLRVASDLRLVKIYE